jgi:hypothetical protein
MLLTHVDLIEKLLLYNSAWIVMLACGSCLLHMLTLLAALQSTPCLPRHLSHSTGPSLIGCRKRLAPVSVLQLLCVLVDLPITVSCVLLLPLLQPFAYLHQHLFLVFTDLEKAQRT